MPRPCTLIGYVTFSHALKLKLTLTLNPRSVPHLYAEEIARAFWDPDMELKQDWDPTLEVFEVKEKLTDLAYVAHLTFKPFWPTTQRDCVLCSEMVPLVNDGWAVCNQSVDHPRYVALYLMVCYIKSN